MNLNENGILEINNSLNNNQNDEKKGAEQMIIEKALEDAIKAENGLDDYRDYYGIVKDVFHSKTKTNKYEQIVFVYEVKDETGYTDILDPYIFTGKSNKYAMLRLKNFITEYGLYPNIMDTKSFDDLANSLKIFCNTKIKVVQEPTGEENYKRYIVTPLQKYNRITNSFVDIEGI